MAPSGQHLPLLQEVGLAMVSILLAAYNGDKYLPQQLASLQAQTYEDFRILWQDDGSTDDTAALLRAASDGAARIRPGTQQGQHLGAAGNFLSLMVQDDAPYTTLCDQDDVWHAEKLARCMQAMQTAEARYGTDTPLLVHHDSRVVSADGTVLHESFFRHQGWDGSACTLPRLLVQNNVTGCTCLMNAALRRLVAEHAQAEKLFMHDWFIALTAAAFGQIIFINEPLLDYRQHSTNALGASRTSLLRRGLAALRMPQKAKERIALTYRHARMFRDAYSGMLPENARSCLDRFIAIESQSKFRRIQSLSRGGYLMQSPITRLGQMLFG